VTPVTSESANTTPAPSIETSTSLISPDASLKQLRKAIISNDFLLVRKLVDAQPALVNSALNDADQTPLHLSSELGSLELVEYLLSKCSADPNRLDEQMQVRILPSNHHRFIATNMG
jgi:ankyrin repeat protein